LAQRWPSTGSRTEAYKVVWTGRCDWDCDSVLARLYGHRSGENQGRRKPRVKEEQPRNIQRADIAPANGYAMVVDGHFKTQFEEEAAAQKVAKELLANYPMLQIEIYDATAKTRTLIK